MSWISISERKDRPGKFKLIWQGPDGVRTTATYGSREAAEAAKAGLERDLIASPVAATLGSAAADFLASKKTEGCKPKTLETYTWLLDGAVKRLGPLLHPGAVTVAMIETYRDGRLADVSGGTVFRELDLVRATLDHAKVTPNPVGLVKLPKKQKSTKDWLRSNEVGPFLDHCTDDFRDIGQFTMFTGLRRNEIVFLQRGDIDLRNCVVQIREKPHLGFSPKSGRARSVPIDPTLRPLVERRLAMVGPKLDAFVFGTRKGERRSAESNWFVKNARRAAERAGIDRPLTFHDLRRTYGAMLIEAGVGIYEVSRLLGHADVRITQEVYAPICGKFLAQEASKLGRYLNQALTRSVPTLVAAK